MGVLLDRRIDAIELGQLLAEHANSLELFAGQWTANAEDCVQEAFIELATQTTRPPKPVAWLYRVVRNRALNASRSARRRTSHERLAALLRNSESMPSELAGDNEHLIDALDSLSPEDRELIVLRIWSGMTWQQIADLIGTSSSSSQRNYVAALRKLKELLEPSCPKNLRYRPT